MLMLMNLLENRRYTLCWQIHMSEFNDGFTNNVGDAYKNRNVIRYHIYVSAIYENLYSNLKKTILIEIFYPSPDQLLF